MLKSILPNVLAATVLIASGGIAAAGECPADQVKDSAITSGATMPKGVTDTVISSIDLSPKGPEFKGQTMRMRRLVIAPGGIVPWHDHMTRPANILVASGTIIEHRSSCAVPIKHKVGDVVAEFGAGFSHWWENKSKKPVELISADIIGEVKTDDHMM